MKSNLSNPNSGFREIILNDCDMCRDTKGLSVYNNLTRGYAYRKCFSCEDIKELELEIKKG